MRKQSNEIADNRLPDFRRGGNTGGKFTLDDRAYALCFALNVVAIPESDGRRYRAVFDSMRIRVKAGDLHSH